MASSYAKTYATLFALASTAASTVATSSAVDLSTKLGGSVYIRFGRRSATAAGAGVNIRLEASFAASLDNSWFPWFVYTTAFAACEAEAVSGTVANGTNVITVASTTNLAAGDLIFIDNTVIANSEWGRIKSVVLNTSVTIEDNLVNTQTGSTMYDTAEILPPIDIPPGIARMRAVIDGASFTQAFACEIRYTTIDSIG